ncbi:hypothetical protein OPT61_g8848 [Boeremia exigua]|uniref:Uncharacterized protein n=1 Tax=Boeremia exigua TaxID=749465 RepID=A0ACC2HY78_9PLEO|nr:hypothetical protein OPT61_g8848 [Boeremia exigua]
MNAPACNCLVGLYKSSPLRINAPAATQADGNILTKPDWSVYMVAAALKCASDDKTAPTYTTTDEAKHSILKTLNWHEAHGEYEWPDFAGLNYSFDGDEAASRLRDIAGDGYRWAAMDARGRCRRCAASTHLCSLQPHCQQHAQTKSARPAACPFGVACAAPARAAVADAMGLKRIRAAAAKIAACCNLSERIWHSHPSFDMAPSSYPPSDPPPPPPRFQVPPPPPPPPDLFPIKLPVILDTDLTTVIDTTNAINIAPAKFDKLILHLQDSNRILKRGRHVRVAEAEALQFIAKSTRVPVPRVFGAYEKDGYGHIFMSNVEGVPLGHVLDTLDKAQIEKVTAQLSEFVGSWMSLEGDYFGSLGFKASRDVFFQHLPGVNVPDREYGPFRTRTEYCNGLINALQNSRPYGRFNANDAHIIERLQQRFGEGRAVFCHGDLNPYNVHVDNEMNVTIVDMGVSGFSIPEREYFEAKSRAWIDPVWSSMIDRFIPNISDDAYALLLELNRELVRYSGI